MTNLEFRYWLQGFYVLSENLFVDEKQIRIIKNHADLVKRTEGYLAQDIALCIEKLETNNSVKRLFEEIVKESF